LTEEAVQKPDWHQFDLVDAMEEGVCYVSDEGTIYFTNEPMENLVGAPPAGLLNKDFLTLFSQQEQGDIQSAIEEARREGKSRIPTNLVLPGKDKTVPVLLRLIRYDQQGSRKTAFYALLLDLTELIEALDTERELRKINRELEDLAVTDPLTGLYNRRYFDQRYCEELKRARRHKTPIAIMMVDLDRFKDINDTYGHQVGDEVLVSAAHCLKETVRGSDFLARFGGEEFVVVILQATAEGVIPAAIRIRMMIQNASTNTDRGVIQTTASIGICCFDPAEEDLEDGELLRRADEALYEAKNKGRNQVVLYGHPNE